MPRGILTLSATQGPTGERVLTFLGSSALCGQVVRLMDKGEDTGWLALAPVPSLTSVDMSEL